MANSPLAKKGTINSEIFERVAKFRENKILMKSRINSVVY